MQLSFFDPEEKDPILEPTLNSLSTGSVFARLKPQHKGYLYMLVSICGAIRYEHKDDRNFVVVNLATGRVFSMHGAEEIEPKPNCVVLEDQNLQLPPNLRKKLNHERKS